MKKLKYLGVLSLQFFLLHNLNAAQITGHLANAKVKKIYLAKVIYATPDQMVRVDSTTLNSDGTYSLTHVVKEPALYYLSVGSNNIKVFLKNNYALELSCDINQWPASITITGDKGGLENTVYLQMRVKYLNSYGLGDIMKYDSYTYPAYADSIRQVMSTALEQLKGGKSIDPVLDSLLHTEITYSKYGMMLAFNIVKSYYTSGKGSYNADNPHFFDFLKNVDLNNDSKAMSDAYIMFMMNYVHYNVIQALYKDKETPGFDGVNQLIWAKEHYKGKVRDYVVSAILKLRIDQNDVTNIKPQIEDYKTYNLDKDYYDRVAKAYAKLAEFAPGNPFPDFNLPDSAGHMHSIKELKGKVVYIDYWASWCGPCRMEMPHSREMIEKYKNNPKVAFVFVSIDTDKKAWLGAMRKENLNGLHLLASGGWSDAICRKYGINSIPRYMLIDKNGNIVNIEAKRPSNGVDKEIDNLLSTK